MSKKEKKRMYILTTANRVQFHSTAYFVSTVVRSRSNNSILKFLTRLATESSKPSDNEALPSTIAS